MLTGSCNCKSVTFEVRETIRSSACHCGQCRKQSGHHWACGLAYDTDLTISGDVKWYASSDIAQRGFCPTCGCFLFWKMKGEEKISYSLGTIDGATGLTLDRHIFIADKGDYYDIADNVPQREN
ncbi:GFA family protein [uncultured Tateyamaria sp.]|uniref:GFA family protein n=1 Tax=uncultured Tateyamaria sp. TaxID=455651 RepID=UPI0026307F77|nr:GFA family protein [uncultured Tateyamaria sp.]